jgi:N-methylhydantoinase B
MTNWALIAVLAAALAPPQDAPSPAPQAPSPEAATTLDDVVVEQPRLEAMVREFIGEVGAPAGRRRGLARWHDRLCVGVVNVRPELGQAVADRVSQVGLELGLDIGEPGCKANVFIVFADDGAALADAMVEHEERLDGDGVDADVAPRVRVRLTKQGTTFAADFAGSDPCVNGPINAPLAVTASAVYYTLLSLTGGDIPPNEGVYDVAKISAPDASVVNAVAPYPVVAANTETSNRIVDVLLAALAKAYPEQVPAGSYGSACVYTLGGVDPRSGRRFVHYETVGGGAGATANAPGASGMRTHMGNTMNLPVEATEAAIPVRFLGYEIVRESAGAGRHRGGSGVRKTFEILADGVEASLLGERTLSPAHGVAGGEPGACAIFVCRRASGEAVTLAAKSGPHKLNRGDRIEMVTAGGGGWGKAKA